MGQRLFLLILFGLVTCFSALQSYWVIALRKRTSSSVGCGRLKLRTKVQKQRKKTRKAGQEKGGEPEKCEGLIGLRVEEESNTG